MPETPSLVEDLLVRLDPHARYEFEERAGIIEFDSNVPRDDAECYALIDLLRERPDALLGMSVLQIDKKNDSVAFVLTTDLDAALDRFQGEDTQALRVPDLANVIKTLFDGIALLSDLK